MLDLSEDTQEFNDDEVDDQDGVKLSDIPFPHGPPPTFPRLKYFADVKLTLRRPAAIITAPPVMHAATVPATAQAKLQATQRQQMQEQYFRKEMAEMESELDPLLSHDVATFRRTAAAQRNRQLAEKEAKNSPDSQVEKPLPAAPQITAAPVLRNLQKERRRWCQHLFCEKWLANRGKINMILLWYIVDSMKSCL